MAHLVKKSSKFVDSGFISKKSGDAFYCETRINGNPSGYKMTPGEQIYFAETGYAIYAKGVVTQTSQVAKVHSLEELFDYYQRTRIRSSRYWFSIANEKIFLQNKDFRFVSIFEYQADTHLLDHPIFLPEEFRGRSSYYNIGDNYKFDQTERNYELNSKIPNSLRLYLFNKWNVGYDKPMIDIDHFVPNSLGGPGNIEENLELVGLSVNRRKSNSVPRGVFVIGKEFCEDRKITLDIPKKFLRNRKGLEQSAEGKALAKEIIKFVNSEKNKLKEIRKFYSDVKKFHRE